MNQSVAASSGERTTAAARRGGIDVFDSLVVVHSIRDGRTGAVLAALSEWASANRDGDARAILPVDGVSLVSLFLDRGTGQQADRLRWYIEVRDDDAGHWADADTTVRRRSPLFSAGLDALLEPGATVHRDGVDGHQLLTHATHPHRQRRYADRCESSLVAPVAGDDVPVAVAMVRVPLRPGLPSRLTALVTRLGNWVKRSDTVSCWLRDQTQTLEAEAMYTESLLFEPAGDRPVLHYYMETESMERLYDAYDASTNVEVRLSDWVMRRVFETPEKVVEYPLESDDDLLVHAVDPDRP